MDDHGLRRTALARWAVYVADGRGSLAKVRERLVRWLTPRRLVMARGVCFSLPCENWVTDYRWRTFETKEPETLEWIDHELRDGDILFDIGANIGIYALYAALRHPQSRVLTFEPEYANLHLLRDNIMANRLQDRIDSYAVALGDRCGVSYLYLQDLSPGAALHTESLARLEYTLTDQRVVWREGISVMTLDVFCEQTGATPNAIKLDVDGTEPAVLRGAQRTLARSSLRTILLELPTKPSARQTCEQLLEAAGLTRRWAQPGGRSVNEIWKRSEQGT